MLSQHSYSLPLGRDADPRLCPSDVLAQIQEPQAAARRAIQYGGPRRGRHPLRDAPRAPVPEPPALRLHHPLLL